MQINVHSLRSTRIVTFALSALAAVSAVYWGLKGSGAAPPSAALPVAWVKGPPVTPQAVARALGGGLAPTPLAAGEASPAAASRYVLTGVVADRSSGGAALISVDGKAAKPIRVGAFVDGRLVLQSVAGRRAVLAAGVDAPAEVTLELPAPGK